ncbi:MAG: methyltransferase domain-containing protein [Rhizobiales bacterium]|nr:methyltransferase domain-containing protein [Hyphomicrobiales bacterium]MBO6697612.1 methyltransferase domain-containing protein [Hyphomicrobiales bacterium]MBO6736133.1 methyltransferase domain-containing protein [Hyphomicrobiales bacterium]MBO6912603.1 methyltransferase domain-containing protein [Hyphomicrobiales bacterium]MBO6956824.1 methyltransferase domain-containing protein [Hyphomicrobiales bacterium]
MPEPDTNRVIDWDAVDALYDEAHKADVTGDTERAIALYRQLMATDPDDHLGVSLRLAKITGEHPAKAPNAYVAALFDQTADRFDSILVDELGYNVPLLIADGLKTLDLGPFAKWLDLGCGTGLCAMALEDVTETRIGVDLAPTMIEIAAELEIYQDLYVGEAVAFLRSEEATGPYTLITAADVLPYLGDLDPLFTALGDVTESGTVLAFSSEHLESDAWDFQVGEHKRFAHSSACLTRTMKKYGWKPLRIDRITVRLEQGEPVPGELVFAQRIA